MTRTRLLNELLFEHWDDPVSGDLFGKVKQPSIGYGFSIAREDFTKELLRRNIRQGLQEVSRRPYQEIELLVNTSLPELLPLLHRSPGLREFFRALEEIISVDIPHIEECITNYLKSEGGQQ